MHGKCLLVDARRILEWAMKTVALTTAKLPKLGWVNFWPPGSKYFRVDLPWDFDGLWDKDGSLGSHKSWGTEFSFSPILLY